MTPTQTAKPSVRALPSDMNISGRTFGPEELENVRRVLESGVLTCTKGKAVREFG
ncbi:MAG: hypothetical protein NTW86_32230 [Candidatus Sumerlaeota bacterium]|nr:hypothetical protein [Candidatus Sumerlaeota bacterium]